MIYEIPRDELFLVGTSEVSLASLHADQIMEAEDLPKRYAGFSTCFRREAGAGGKDTRGIFRVHQFDKVEMFSFVEPGSSSEEHERILASSKSNLGPPMPSLRYRLAAPPPAIWSSPLARVEGWIPSQERFRS
jgi:seryl-tRNA synthetase